MVVLIGRFLSYNYDEEFLSIALEIQLSSLGYCYTLINTPAGAMAFTDQIKRMVLLIYLQMNP